MRWTVIHNCARKFAIARFSPSLLTDEHYELQEFVRTKQIEEIGREECAYCGGYLGRHKVISQPIKPVDYSKGVDTSFIPPRDAPEERGL